MRTKICSSHPMYDWCGGGQCSNLIRLGTSERWKHSWVLVLLRGGGGKWAGTTKAVDKIDLKSTTDNKLAVSHASLLEGWKNTVVPCGFIVSLENALLPAAQCCHWNIVLDPAEWHQRLWACIAYGIIRVMVLWNKNEQGRTRMNTQQSFIVSASCCT